jgi:hypothetical protein
MRAFKMLAILTFATVTCASVCADDEVIVSIAPGENYVIELKPEDSFLSVIESISMHLDAAQALHAQEDLYALTFDYNEGDLNLNNSKEFLIDVLVSAEGVSAKVKNTKPAGRNYNAPLTTQEKDDIRYILKTLANTSVVNLLSYKSSLKKAGDRIDHVHPLKFLICIFTDEELKVCIRNIQGNGNSWVWKEFQEGITKSLAKESNVDNINGFLKDFASQIKINEGLILPSAQSKRWEEFVNTLISTVPRQGGPGRYDM